MAKEKSANSNKNIHACACIIICFRRRRSIVGGGALKVKPPPPNTVNLFTFHTSHFSIYICCSFEDIMHDIFKTTADIYIQTPFKDILKPFC